MANLLTVTNLKHLYAMQNHEDGEMAFVQDIEKYYIWHPEDGWQEMDVRGKGLELDLYSLNKNIINQFEPMAREKLWDVCNDLVFNFFVNTKPNTHYMLLCREYNYYTIFEPHPNCEVTEIESFVEVVIGIIEELGPVYSAESINDGTAIEFWIKPDGCNEPMVFMLFPYDGGVVYYV